MKPDGVATTPGEPSDEVVEPVPEAAANEEQVQQDFNPSPIQTERPENEGEQEGANSTLPPPKKEVDGKFSKPKDKAKAPVKTKPGTTGTKATTLPSAASRPGTAHSRVANGGVKAAVNSASKKPVGVTTEMKKKSAPAGTSAQVKKVPGAPTVPPRTQVKATERQAVASARPAPSASSGMRKTTAATSSALSKTGGSNTAVKPKTTTGNDGAELFCTAWSCFQPFRSTHLSISSAAPRPATAPAAKASISAASKAAPVPKTTR